MEEKYKPTSVQFWIFDIEDDVMATGHKIARAITDMYNRGFVLLTSIQIKDKLVYHFIKERRDAENNNTI